MDIKFFKPGMPDWNVVSKDIESAYRNGMLYPGPYTERLEHNMAEMLGVKRAVAVSNCSDALMLLLCDFKKGDKVIIPSYTFRATYQALEWNGLTPVLTDVDSNGYIDPGVLEDCLTEHSDAKCVMPVNLWGSVDYVEEIDDICKRHGVRLVYDAAHGMSTELDGRQVGNIGDAMAFSIAVTKPLACGEGGIVATNSENLYRLVSYGRLHGNVLGNLDCVQKGLNAKIGEINSILALHGMGMMGEFRDAREAVAQRYMYGLSDLPVRFQKINPRCRTSRKDFGMWVESEDLREALRLHLESRGIGIKRYFFPAVHNFENFEGIVFKVDNSDFLSKTCINLPCYDQLTLNEIDFIIASVREFYEKR